MKPLRLGLAVLVFSVSLFAQDPQQDPAAALEAARTRLQALSDPLTEEDKKWQPLLSSRIALLRELIGTRKSVEEIVSSEQIAQRRSTVDAGLDAERAQPEMESLRLNDPSEIDSYEEAGREADRARDAVRKSFDDLDAQASDLSLERSRLTERQAALAPRLEATPESGDVQAEYALTNARLERLVISERQEYIADQLPSLTSLRPVLQSELDLAELRRGRAQSRLDLARAEVTRLNEAAAAEALAQAAEAERAAERETDPIESFRQLIAAEIQICKAETAAIRNQLTELKSLKEEEDGAIEWLEKESARVEDRFALRGSQDVQVVRRTLASVERSRDFLERHIEPKVEADSRALQSTLANLLDRLWDIQLPEEEGQALPAFLAEVAAHGPGREVEARTAFKESMEAPEGLIDALREEREVIEEAQVEVDSLEQVIEQRRNALNELSRLIARQLLWRRDEPVLSPVRLAGLGESFAEIIEATGSAEAGEAYRAARDGNRNLVILALGLLLVGIWPYLSMAIKKPTHAWGLRWLVLALLRVFPVPIGLWLLAQTAYAAPGESIIGNLGILLELLAWLSIVRRIARELLSPPAGLAVRFRIMLSGVATHLLNSLRFALIGAQFTWAPAVALEAEPLTLHVLPQALLFAWYLIFTWVLIRLFSKRKQLMGEWARTEPGLGVFLGVFRYLIIPYQVGIVVGGAIGYQAFARYGSHRVIWVTGVVLVLAWLYAFSVRLLQSLLERVGERARARAEASGEDPPIAVTVGLARPLSLMIVLAIGLPLAYFAGFGSPLRAILEEVQILEIDSDSQTWITLWTIVLAVAWIALGHLVGTNIGKLYENLIAPLVGEQERGARFAFITLARYAIVAIAWSAALLTLGVSLESIGWLLTAVSVGLGFGLQEIVANFISGLILLFERPIRVGDTITVGETGGTVDSISIRSTVVTNWERQTIVIPNKNFITQNLTNWTRNDEVMRRTLYVRVTYGADITKVLRILDELVGNHPKVLEDPPHRIWFEEFGDFGLDIKIWFFTQIDDGLRTKTELHAAIYEKFRHEGIDFPVVTRDLRVEDSKGDFPMLPSSDP
ncbi:MAG: mechanosensitive ion channel domain-containing protein [Planctomycetota bacterium]